MKIDLYNNHHIFQQELKQSYRLSPWLKKLGLQESDLLKHPRMDDIVTLITIHNQLKNRMSWQEQKIWYAYWKLVYDHEFVLTKKFWNKFDRIVKAIDQREARLQAHRDHLRAKKKTKLMAHAQNTENMDQDKTAKGSCPLHFNTRV